MSEKTYKRKIPALIAHIINEFNGCGTAAVLEELGLRYEYYPEDDALIAVHMSQMKRRGHLSSSKDPCPECARSFMVYRLTDQGRMFYLTKDISHD